VISGCLCNCGSPRTSHARQNMAALKKHFGFYTSIFCKVLALIVGQNPFSQRNNLSNTGDTPPLPKRRNGRELGALVTTTHLFWPNQRRKPASSLPSWLRNFHFPPTERQQGGGGFRSPNPSTRPRPKSALGNFLPNGSPAYRCCGKNVPPRGAKIVERMREYSEVIN